MEKKFEVSEQDFIESKVRHYLRSVMQSAKLSSINKEFLKRKGSNDIELFLFSIEKVLKKYGK